MTLAIALWLWHYNERKQGAKQDCANNKNNSYFPKGLSSSLNIPELMVAISSKSIKTTED